MNNKSMYWGIAITVVWLAVIFLFWFFGDLDSPESLNELGDFLAGIFAPVAFLWLVLGYVQQGKQLDQNTKALEQQERALQLQIEEMKASVEQQRKLVETNNKNYSSQLQAALPKFKLVISNVELFYNQNELNYDFEITSQNIGAEISDFLVVCHDTEEILFGENIFRRGEQSTKIKFNTVEHVVIHENDRCSYIILRINYIDVYNHYHLEIYHLEMLWNIDNNKRTEWFVIGLNLIDGNFQCS